MITTLPSTLRLLTPSLALLTVTLFGVSSCDSDDDDDDGDPAPAAAQIDPAFAGVTFINLMTAPAGRQSELADLLTEAMEEEASLVDEFVSASVHESLDNDYLLNYARWSSSVGVDTVVARLGRGLTPKLAEVFAATSPEFHPYRVYSQTSVVEEAVVVGGDAWTMINFLVPHDSASQSEVAEALSRAMREEALGQPGFRNASVHVSLDNDYVVNYAQWDDQASVDAMVARVAAGDAPLLARAFSIADPEFHPYGEIVTTVPD